MPVNPAGYQSVLMAPTKAISCMAREVISGGQIVAVSGAAGVVSSGINSFNAETDLLVVTGGSGTNVLGIAQSNVASGEPVSVALDGFFIVRTADDVDANTVLAAGGDDAVETVTAGANGADILGTSLTAGSSGAYLVLQVGGARG